MFYAGINLNLLLELIETCVFMGEMFLSDVLDGTRIKSINVTQVIYEFMHPQTFEYIYRKWAVKIWMIY